MNKDKKQIKKRSPSKKYNYAFKRVIIREYEKGILNKDRLRIKYGIGGNSVVLSWCRKYSKLYYSEKGENIGHPMKDQTNICAYRLPSFRQIYNCEQALYLYLCFELRFSS